MHPLLELQVQAIEPRDRLLQPMPENLSEARVILLWGKLLPSAEFHVYICFLPIKARKIFRASHSKLRLWGLFEEQYSLHRTQPLFKEDEEKGTEIGHRN